MRSKTSTGVTYLARMESELTAFKARIASLRETVSRLQDEVVRAKQLHFVDGCEKKAEGLSKRLATMNSEATRMQEFLVTELSPEEAALIITTFLEQLHKSFADNEKTKAGMLLLAATLPNVN